MDTNDAPVILPELDEQDMAALEAILGRTIRAQDRQARDREELKIINERIAAAQKIRDSAYAALKVFGFEAPPVPEGEQPVNVWTLVRAVMGAERYDRIIAVARGAEFPALLSKMGDDQPPASAKHENAALGEREANAVKHTVPIRVAILDYLRAVGEQGSNVAEVKRHLADAYGITVHEKTPGMTLYRLLKDGLVRREGRTWFAMPYTENKENEAPSGRTAGASETALAAQ
jgi:hypothetical protein